MDKNTIIGLVLIVAVLFGFSYFTGKNASQQQQQPQTEQTAQQQASAQQAQTQQATAAAPATDTTSVFAPAYAADTASAGYVTLRNDNVTVEIAKKGGAIGRVRLNNYLSYKDFHEGNDNPLLLYDDQNASMGLQLSTTTGIVNTADYLFVAADQRDSTAVTMKLIGRDSTVLAIRYELLRGDNYMLNVTVETQGLQRYLTNKTASIEWRQKIQQQEKGEYFENQYSTITYKLHDDDTEKLNEHGNDEQTAEGNVDWIAFKNQYFSSVLIAANTEFSSVQMKSEELDAKASKGFLKNYEATMQLNLDPKTPTQLQMYFGPNSFNLLKSMDQYATSEKNYDLEDLVYLGWPLFKWINRFFTIYVFDFLTSLGLPMGIVLLLITLLLRAIVYVPTKKSFLSSAKMRVLKPKVDEINAKYPDQADAMKKQQEMMTLYSQYGVSPMGGCLPMLIQMPIWIAMFNFVPNAIELRQQGFLWADDLSTYDSVIDFGTNIWGIGDHLSLFCLLFCGTNLLYSFMSIRQQRETMSTEQAKQMKIMQWMMYLMPVMFFFMFNKYSAGLNYYYFISLLASALTMWYLRRRTDDKAILAKLEENYRANKSNPAKKTRGLAARLAEMQKQAEEINRQRTEELKKRTGQK